MILITKIENKIIEVFKSMALPHLPVEWQKWMVNNVWWITTVGVVVAMVIGLQILSTLFGVLYYMIFLDIPENLLPILHYTKERYTAWVLLSLLVSLAYTVAMVVVMAKAVTPLKNFKKSGWDSLFLIYLAGVVLGFVNVVLRFNIVNVLLDIFAVLIGAIIGAYFLFEIRSYFQGQDEAAEADTATATSTPPVDPSVSSAAPAPATTETPVAQPTPIAPPEPVVPAVPPVAPNTPTEPAQANQNVQQQ